MAGANKIQASKQTNTNTPSKSVGKIQRIRVNGDTEIKLIPSTPANHVPSTLF